MWLDDRLYIGGDPASRWYRNIAVNPEVSINLSETGDQALIMEGKISAIYPDHELAERLAEDSNAKYNYGQEAAIYEGEEMLEFRPDTVFAWKLLYEDATRWTVGGTRSL